MPRLLFISLLLSAITAAAQQPPTYRVGRTVDTVEVDGRLDEFTWALLPRVGAFRDIRDAGRETAPTQAAIAWDDRYLYIAFACGDREPWGTMLERDSHLWQEEVVEVFLDPDGDGRNYAELEVSPHNAVVDLLIPHKPDGSVTADEAARWDIEGLRTATAKYASGWTVEIGIPWQALEAAGVTERPKWRERWRVGLYRIERPGGAPAGREMEELRSKRDAATGEERTRIEQRLKEYDNASQLLAWSPTRNSFHDPERFGVVEFVLKP